MRVLVATTAGSGHFGPLVPFARSCADAGHAVRVAAPASFATAVADAGFEHAPFADVAPELLGAVFGRLPSLSPDEANRIVVGEVFGRLDAQGALPGMTATIDEWHPDLVLREPCEFASWAAATARGVPQVMVSIGLSAMGEALIGALDQPLAELAALAGLSGGAPGPFDGDVILSLVPAGFDDRDDARLRRFNDGTVPDRVASLPPAWGDPDQPLVYVTYGSVTGSVGPFGAVYGATVEALAAVPYRVLLTTGQGVDIAGLGPLPDNVHVERWWPQSAVMPSTTAVVDHGGFGTMMTALSAGLPQVVLPLFAADQFHNAARIAEVGAGVMLEGGVDVLARLPEALHELLTVESYLASAHGIAVEIAALPPPSTAVHVLEAVAG